MIAAFGLTQNGQEQQQINKKGCSGWCFRGAPKAPGGSGGVLPVPVRSGSAGAAPWGPSPQQCRHCPHKPCPLCTQSYSHGRTCNKKRLDVVSEVSSHFCIDSVLLLGLDHLHPPSLALSVRHFYVAMLRVLCGFSAEMEAAG